MISSLVCQLQVIVVSTVALERLSRAYDKEVSVEAFMRRYFDLEWIAVRLNFFVGVLSFVTAIGLRAWACVEIMCQCATPSMLRPTPSTIEGH